MSNVYVSSGQTSTGEVRAGTVEYVLSGGKIVNQTLDNSANIYVSAGG